MASFFVLSPVDLEAGPFQRLVAQFRKVRGACRGGGTDLVLGGLSPLSSPLNVVGSLSLNGLNGVHTVDVCQPDWLMSQVLLKIPHLCWVVYGLVSGWMAGDSFGQAEFRPLA